jgi:hypothetical protein
MIPSVSIRTFFSIERSARDFFRKRCTVKFSVKCVSLELKNEKLHQNKTKKFLNHHFPTATLKQLFMEKY